MLFLLIKASASVLPGRNPYLKYSGTLYTSMASDKVVQTELPENEYERLARIAEREDKSLKQVLREAANEYMSRHEEIDMSDPFFEVSVGKESGKEEKTAEKTDEYLYGE